MIGRRFALFCLAILTAALPGRAQVIVSEFMADNRSGLADRDGYTGDWIELYNQGRLAVDLDGWFLSDDPKELTKWRFPAVRIPSQGFLVVHASGKDRRDPRHPLHTNFRLSAGGDRILLVGTDGETIEHRVEFGDQLTDVSQGFAQAFQATVLLPEGAMARYFVPRARPSSPAALLGFDDSSWHVGQGPFGFDYKREPTLKGEIRTDVGAVLRGVQSSIYYRIEFDVLDPAAFHLAVLRIRYEAGFLAILNGVEIARRRAPSEIDYDVEADVGLEPRDPEQAEYFAIPDGSQLLRPGRNLLFVQAMTENPNCLEHFLGAQIIGYAIGTPDTRELAWLNMVSPGRPNGVGRAEAARTPTVEPAASLFAESCTATLDGDPRDTIHFTLDGTDPSVSSPIYTGSIRISDTCELRARAFRDGARWSPVVVGRYTRLGDDLATFESNLPIVVISTHGSEIVPKNFVGASAHVVTPDASGRARLLDPPDYRGAIGIKTRGSSTLHRPKKGYGVELRDATGAERESPLMGLPADAHWVLYAPHNFDQAHLRNPLAYELARRMGLDSPRTRFCEVFVNHANRPVRREDYVGLYALVERISRGDHRVDIEKLSPDDAAEPEISGGYILKIDRPGPGDMGFESHGQRLQYVYPKERHITDVQRAWLRRYFDEFGRVLDGPTSADETDGYAAWIDVDNWIDYHFFSEYVKNPDAYTLSTYFYKPRGGKLRMGPVWDYDRAMRTNDEDYWVGRPSRPYGWTGDCYHGWWGMLFRDPAFRKRYRERGRAWLGGELELGRVHALIDAMAAEIEEAEERDRLRWPIIGAGGWYDEILDLKEWLGKRTRWFESELLDAPRFVPSDEDLVFPFTVAIEHDNAGGTVWVTTDGADPKLSNGEVSPRARIYTDPIVVDRDVSIRARVRVGDTWSRAEDRWFVRSLATLAVTEIMYNPDRGGDYEFIELTNFGAEPVDLRGVRLEGGIRFHFAMGGVETLAPGERVVVVRDRVRFAEVYDTTRFRVAGEYLGRFSNTEGEVFVYGSVGEELARARYVDEWHAEADAKGASLEAVEPRREIDDARHWRPSAVAGGSPGR